MCRKQSKIISIREEILDAIDEAFQVMAKKDYISFILFIGRADIINGLKPYQGTDCVIDYQLDTIYDETRAEFYVRYLRRNYSRDGFTYDGDSGIDDMHIELMIYSHLWDSSYYIKSLMRIASIVNGNGYIWNPEIDWMHKDVFMKKWIIDPLNASGLKLGPLVETCYDPSVRNAFAHSLYTIDAERRQITVRPRKGIKTLSFDEFQSLFLHSVILMNKMENALETNHRMAAEKNTALTDVFMTPDGVRIQVFGELVQRGKIINPEFRIAKIIGE
ncbi:MAG: hypothetical protein IJK44_04645 [Bacteroidales bacterium]|nr:hypothetical protein [Bacteroidales bacterium]